jgi:UDP-N-acetylmuramate-alanine ligase
VTYGTNPQAMVRAENCEMGPDGARFDVVIQNGETTRIEGLHLPMAGWHNVSNALAAIAVARELDVSDDAIREGLAGFGGVKRRFTTTGVVEGVRIVDDYGHHPVEIAAVLKAARQVAEGRVIAVVQPHRYTRLRDLMEEFSTCFADADVVHVADVYPAGEEPIEGVDKHALVDGIRRFGHRDVQPLENAASAAARHQGRGEGRRCGRAARGRGHHRLGLRPAGPAGGDGWLTGTPGRSSPSRTLRRRWGSISSWASLAIGRLTKPGPPLLPRSAATAAN